MSGQATPPALEQRALRESVASSVVLAATALVWGVLAESRVLLFDGIYTVLGIVLTGWSMLAAAPRTQPRPAASRSGRRRRRRWTSASRERRCWAP